MLIREYSLNSITRRNVNPRTSHWDCKTTKREIPGRTTPCHEPSTARRAGRGRALKTTGANTSTRPPGNRATQRSAPMEDNWWKGSGHLGLAHLEEEGKQNRVIRELIWFIWLIITSLLIHMVECNNMISTARVSSRNQLRDNMRNPYPRRDLLHDLQHNRFKQYIRQTEANSIFIMGCVSYKSIVPKITIQTSAACRARWIADGAPKY